MPLEEPAVDAVSQGSKRWIPDQVRDDSLWGLTIQRPQEPKLACNAQHVIPAPEPGPISLAVIPAPEPVPISQTVIPAPEPGSIVQSGFTLIEVLVALGITAIALMAGLQATGSLSRNAERQTVSMLGQICADNQLIALRLRRQLPDTGNSSVECLQAGRLLQVEVSVRPTPNPNFRRVDARVLDQGAYVLQMSTVMGRN